MLSRARHGPAIIQSRSECHKERRLSRLCTVEEFPPMTGCSETRKEKTKKILESGLSEGVDHARKEKKPTNSNLRKLIYG